MLCLFHGMIVVHPSAVPTLRLMVPFLVFLSITLLLPKRVEKELLGWASNLLHPLTAISKQCSYHIHVIQSKWTAVYHLSTAYCTNAGKISHSNVFASQAPGFWYKLQGEQLQKYAFAPVVHKPGLWSDLVCIFISAYCGYRISGLLSIQRQKTAAKTIPLRPAVTSLPSFLLIWSADTDVGKLSDFIAWNTVTQSI